MFRYKQTADGKPEKMAVEKKEVKKVLNRFKELGAKVLVGAAIILTATGVGKCGSDSVEKPPIEQPKDANGSSDVTETKDTGQGKDVQTDDIQDAGQLPDVQSDIGQEDIGPKDTGSDTGEDIGGDVTGGDIDQDSGLDGGDVSDIGPTDTCDGQQVTETVTRDEKPDVKDIDGNSVPVTMTFTDEKDTICGQVQTERKNLKIQIKFDTPLDLDNTALAEKSIQLNVLGQKLEIQQTASESELIMIVPRMDWRLDGPFSPQSPIETIDGEQFRCVRLPQYGKKANFDWFAGGPVDTPSVALGNYKCRIGAEPAYDYPCAKMQKMVRYEPDGGIYNGEGYITGITAKNRAVSLATGQDVQTKAMFEWQKGVNEGAQVIIDGSAWLVSAVIATKRTENQGGVDVDIYTIQSIELTRKTQ